MKKDFTNAKKGKLTWIKEIGKNERGYVWEVKCDCGNLVHFNTIKFHNTLSCGCLGNGDTKKVASMKIKHGLANTRFFKIWQGIKYRCISDTPYNSKWYKGNHIYFSNKWNDFINFKNDMYEKYKEHVKEYGEKQTQIDRIDNKKGYSKDNCRWATCYENANNKSTTKFYEINNKKFTIRDLANICKCRYGLIALRLRRGFSLKDALTTDVYINGEFKHKMLTDTEFNDI